MTAFEEDNGEITAKWWLLPLICLLMLGVGFAVGLVFKNSKTSQTISTEIAVDNIVLARDSETGTTTTIGDWAGKIRLINFWASWCAPCLEEVPHLIEIQKKYSSRNLQVLGPAVEYADTGVGFAESMKMNYPVFFNGPDTLSTMDKLGDQYGALPFTVLIAADGSILETASGGMSLDQLIALIEPHLAPIAP